MAAPFRVCDLAGAWHAVDLAPDASEAGAEKAIAAVVRLAPGTFGLTNDHGDGASIRGGLAGNWRVVRLEAHPITPPKAAAGVDEGGGKGVRTDWPPRRAQHRHLTSPPFFVASTAGRDFWGPALAALYPGLFPNVFYPFGGDAADGRLGVLRQEVVERPPASSMQSSKAPLPWWRWFGSEPGGEGGHRRD